MYCMSLSCLLLCCDTTSSALAEKCVTFQTFTFRSILSMCDVITHIQIQLLVSSLSNTFVNLSLSRDVSRTCSLEAPLILIFLGCREMPFLSCRTYCYSVSVYSICTCCAMQLLAVNVTVRPVPCLYSVPLYSVPTFVCVHTERCYTATLLCCLTLGLLAS